jgi:hypothetical protein
MHIFPSQKGGGQELGEALDISDGRASSFPTGVIVGTARIEKCERESSRGGHYCWHLSNVKRLKRPRKPKGRPQPVWFRPF